MAIDLPVGQPRACACGEGPADGLDAATGGGAGGLSAAAAGSGGADGLGAAATGGGGVGAGPSGDRRWWC